MKMTAGAILFILLPLAAIAYVGWHVWVVLPLSIVWKCVVLGFGLACFLAFFFSLSGRLDHLPLPLARVLYVAGTSTLIVLLYLFMAFLLLDVGRLLRMVPYTWLHHNAVTAVALTGGLATLLLCGNLNYRHKVRVPLTLTTNKPLPKDGYTIVMATDLHLGYHNTRAELARWVDLMNAERPDLILIAGDIVDISVHPLIEEDMAAEFHRLTAPVYACLGNHEYYSRTERAQLFYRDAGIHLLSDTAAVVDSCIVLMGRDDRTNPRRKRVAQLAQEASQLLPLTEHLTILLDHQPYHLEDAEAAGIDFQLSGHTHRGQVWPLSWITDALYECSWGSHQRGRTRYYISSGLGIWGGMFRIGTQSEYVVVTVKKSPSS